MSEFPVSYPLPPPPGPALPLQLPVFAQTRLANGLNLVVIERRGLPLVTALLSLQAGSLLDPPGKSGLAELSFSVLVKGARRGSHTADASALAAAADALGSGIDSSSGAQASRLAMTVMSPHLNASLGLLADLLRTPTLPALEIENSRLQLQQAIRQEAADPAALATRLAWRLLWGDSPAGRLSSEQSLARIRPEDVQAFYHQHIRPERTTLVLAGDLDLARGKALAELHFGGWRPPLAGSVKAAPADGPRPLGPQTLLVDLPGSALTSVLVLAPYPAQGARAQARVGALATAVLGTGYSSRINQQVRIKRGLSYGAYSSASSLPGGGLLTLSAQTQAQSAAEVAALLRDELLSLSSAPVPADELLARQLGLIGDFGRQLETTEELAALTADQLERGQPLADLALLADELKAVTADQLQAFAQRYWPAPAVRSVVVGDLAQAGEALRRQFPQAGVIPAAELDLASPQLRRQRIK